MSEQAKIEADGAAAPAKGKWGKRKVVIAAAAAALLIGGGGGAYALFGGSDAPAAHGEDAESADAEEGEDGEAEAFIDVPPMMVNLRSPDGAARFIKIHMMLVPASPAKGETIKAKLPLLLDAFQPFVRELRAEDLAGSAAVFRIKEELLRRSVETVGPGQVKNVLIQDLVQQ